MLGTMFPLGWYQTARFRAPLAFLNVRIHTLQELHLCLSEWVP